MKKLLLTFFTVLAFAAPASAAEEAPRMVFAHWLIPMNYTTQETSSQRNINDVRAAMEAGIDGFALNVFSGRQANGLLNAFIMASDMAGAKDFKLFLSADMSLGFKPEDIVSVVKTYGNDPHYLKINGKPVLSTYSGGKKGDAWWKSNVLDPLAMAGIPVTFIPNFDRPNQNGDTPSYENWLKVIASYPSIDGLFNFLMPGSTPFYSNDANIGHHWWSTLEAEEALAQALRDKGKIFMAPFMPYYWAACHPVRQYMEHQGGRGMDNWWKSIITKQKPQLVQIVTWNDYSESSYIQPTNIPTTKTPGLPSFSHTGYYELLKYYIAWYKNNKKPAITKDALFYFQRTHPANAQVNDDQSSCKLGPISEKQKWGNIKDVAYVTTALTRPADLVVRYGAKEISVPVAAGLTTTDIPLKEGTATYELRRNGKKLTEIDSVAYTQTPDTLNFNLASGFTIAGSRNSATWMPDVRWKNGDPADWFTP